MYNLQSQTRLAWRGRIQLFQLSWMSLRVRLAPNVCGSATRSSVRVHAAWCCARARAGTDGARAGAAAPTPLLPLSLLYCRALLDPTLRGRALSNGYPTKGTCPRDATPRWEMERTVVGEGHASASAKQLGAQPYTARWCATSVHCTRSRVLVGWTTVRYDSR